MSVSEDLKLTAQLRKAILPLVKLLKTETDKKFDHRLDVIEQGLTKLASEGVKVEVKAPDISVQPANVDLNFDDLVRVIKKQHEELQADHKSEVAYEPHDQASDSPYQYSGFANSNGDWYIQRVSKGEQRYAKGHGDYAKSWGKRSKLKYGYLDESR